MRAIEMFYADYFEHRRADGRSCSSFDCFGFNVGSENIAIDYFSLIGAVDGWYNSTKGHRENMLSASWTEVGFGCFNGYYVQVFR